MVEEYGIRKHNSPRSVGFAFNRRQRRINLLPPGYCIGLPNLFARSPRRGPSGWKNARSYCSGVSVTVTCRLNDAPLDPLESSLAIAWSIFVSAIARRTDQEGEE